MVKMVVNCVLRKCDAFKRAKVNKWNKMRISLNCMIVWSFGL